MVERDEKGNSNEDAAGNCKGAEWNATSEEIFHIFDS